MAQMRFIKDVTQSPNSTKRTKLIKKMYILQNWTPIDTSYLRASLSTQSGDLCLDCSHSTTCPDLLQIYIHQHNMALYVCMYASIILLFFYLPERR